MKKIRIIFAAFFVVALLVVSACGNNGGGDNPQKAERTAAVSSLYITHGEDVLMSGLLSVDVALQTVELDALVLTSGNPAYTLTFASDNHAVATVSGKTVTLVSAGEAVITASAGSKQHSIVLIVGDDSAPETFAITVINGTSSVTSAPAGAFVTLTPGTVGGSVFVRWSSNVEGLWINGNIFRMPDSPVIMSAVFDGVPLEIDRIEINKPNLALLIDQSETLQATVIQTGIGDVPLTWSVENERDLLGASLPTGSVITVDQDGTVTANGFGTATIKASTLDFMYSGECEASVTNFLLHGGSVEGLTQVGEGLDAVSIVRAYMVEPAQNLTLVADNAPAGGLFVGWETDGARFGNIGSITQSYTAPNDPAAVRAVFSMGNNLFTAGSATLNGSSIAGIGIANDNTDRPFGRVSGNTAIAITNGNSGGAADADLEGFSGIGIGIPGDAQNGDHARIPAATLNNVTAKGQVLVTYILKNRHETLDVSVDITPVFYNSVRWTEEITVPAGETVKHSVVVPYGFVNPDYVVRVTQDVAGDASQRIPLDIVARHAAAFTSLSDPLFPTQNAVKLDSFPNPDNILADNDLGLILFSAETNAMNNRGARITNFPTVTALDETVIFFKVTNYNSTAVSYSFRFSTGVNLAPHFGTARTVALAANSTQTFSMTVINVDNPETVHFWFSWSNSTVTVRNFSIQMSLSDVFT
ncbi:MAG: Ig-like domain-containing protein [Firmicutes bacterium]|nr:Ig-like domain-containing protein [Bacillota bacterium]